jgi:hypothetical protein
MRRAWIIAVLFLALTGAQAHRNLLGFFRSLAYGDLCSQPGISCVDGYSVVHRAGAGNNDMFQLTRTSDSAVNYLTNLYAGL